LLVLAASAVALASLDGVGLLRTSAVVDGPETLLVLELESSLVAVLLCDLVDEGIVDATLMPSSLHVSANEAMASLAMSESHMDAMWDCMSSALLQMDLTSARFCWVLVEVI
jgi:hypothetical protein